MDDVKILQAEVAALRAEIRRLTARPTPDLSYYVDLNDVIAAIRERGVHFEERGVVTGWLERLCDYNDELHAELRDTAITTRTIDY